MATQATSQSSGWAVRVVTLVLGSDSTVSDVYAVRTSNVADASAKVSDHIRATPDQRVEVVGKITSRTLDILGVPPGGVLGPV